MVSLSTDDPLQFHFTKVSTCRQLHLVAWWQVSGDWEDTRLQG